MRILVLFSVLLTVSLQTAEAVDVPQPPAGFTWQEVPELKAAFLRPNGWFFKREEQKGTLAYFITKENIEKTGQFQTGLTINVFHLKKDPAVERGKDMIDQISTTKHGEKWSRDFGPFREFGCRAKDTDPSGLPLQTTLRWQTQRPTRCIFLFFKAQSLIGILHGPPANRSWTCWQSTMRFRQRVQFSAWQPLDE